MEAKQKLIQKFLTDKNHITIEQCGRLLTIYGYSLRKGGGSHRTYHQKRNRPITIISPKGTKYLKPVYIELIIKYLKLEG